MFSGLHHTVINTQLCHALDKPYVSYVLKYAMYGCSRDTNTAGTSSDSLMALRFSLCCCKDHKNYFAMNIQLLHTSYHVHRQCSVQTKSDNYIEGLYHHTNYGANQQI